jgi:hypothetical protein
VSGLKRPAAPTYQAMEAVRIPKAPPAVWRPLFPVNSATKSRRKVRSKKKNKRTSPRELRKEATNWEGKKKKKKKEEKGSKVSNAQLFLFDRFVGAHHDESKDEPGNQVKTDGVCHHGVTGRGASSSGGVAVRDAEPWDEQDGIAPPKAAI